MADYITAPLYPLPTVTDLENFLQAMFVGLSGLPANLVWKKIQPQMPKSPPANTDWMSFHVQRYIPDANACVDLKADGSPNIFRTETLEIQVTNKGPNADTYAGAIRDGFQIDVNRFALLNANMGFIEMTDGLSVPDLAGGIWIRRIESTLRLTRQIQRNYPVQSFTSAEINLRSRTKVNYSATIESPRDHRGE